MPSKWYLQSFPYCDMFFIDTNFKHLSEDIIQKQLNDTISSIQNSKKRWKILCGHHTWRSIGGHGNAEERHEKFMDELLSKVQINIYICGHDHCKSLIKVGKHDIPTLVIGTGGKSYDDSLLFLEKTDQDNSVLEYFSPNLGVCSFEVTQKKLSATFYDEKCTEEFTYEIEK
jgi:hypothetical protein